MPTLKYNEAIRHALAEKLTEDENVVVMGLGVPDPTGVFGTTVGLAKEFGDDRVLDVPCAENGMTGIAIGMAIGGKKVVFSHQRVDFALLTVEQIINQAAKWHFMFAGQDTVPIVIRLIIGRGWGQGPQHSQFLPTLFTHIPGLKVFAPVFPSDARTMMRRAIEDPNPVIFFEHRWLHFGEEVVDLESTADKGEGARTIRHGKDITLVSYSYGVLECREAATHLAKFGIEADVIDLRELRPLDMGTVEASVRRTGNLVVLEHTWGFGSIGSDIISQLVLGGVSFKHTPARICLPEHPIPTGRSQSATYYPGMPDIVSAVRKMFSRDDILVPAQPAGFEEDKPNPRFKGPF